MTLNEFKELTGAEMCELVNRYMENHTSRNFKTGEMEFTFAQAEKALEEKGVYKISGVYRTEEEAMSFLEGKRKQRNKRELTQENIEQLLTLLEPEMYKKLITLAGKYDYVSSFILREDRGIKIKSGDNDDLRQSSFRVYGTTMDRWKEFTKQNRAYTATDLLNTALIEFMENHRF